MRGRSIAKKIATVGKLSTFFLIAGVLKSLKDDDSTFHMGGSQKVPSNTSPQMKSASNPDEDAKQ